MLTQEAINKLQHDATAAGVLAASNGHATAAYKALENIHERKQGQQDFAEWLEEWGGCSVVEHIAVEDSAVEHITVEHSACLEALRESVRQQFTEILTDVIPGHPDYVVIFKK